MNEFSSEITTGMSAPPMAITITTPSARASAMASTSSSSRCVPTNCNTASRRMAPNMTAFTSFCAGRVTGLPVRISCSFPNATIDPAKLIEPTIAENSVDHSSLFGMTPLPEVAMWNSPSAISAAAPPPTPLNSATICGMAVIFTARAE